MIELPSHYYFVKNLKTGIHYAVSFPKLQELLALGYYESLGQVQEYMDATIIPDKQEEYEAYLASVYDQL